MEVKEEKLMEEEQRVPEKTIPLFTVLKNGAILKNIFVINCRDSSSPERNGSTVSDDDEIEEILVVGRHPDCDILLTHPSISRFHLEIRSMSLRQKLFVTDLSSVHGTWVRDQRVEPHACVEVEEGDTIRIGGSTRIYRLHWIPLSRAYDFDNPFVSPLDASTVMEQEEENRMIDAENLEVAQQQSLVNTRSSDDGDLHLDMTSEGTGSSVPSEDEDTYFTTREMSLPLASPSVLARAGDSVKSQKLQFIEDLQTLTKWDLDVVEAAEDKPSSSCSPSKQLRGGYVEGLGCFELFVAAEVDEYDVRGDGGFHLNVMSERMESSVPNEEDDPYLAATETSSLPLPTNSIETGRLQLMEDVQASPELAINILEANVENPSSCCSPSKGHNDGCLEASGCSAFKLAAEVEILSLHREISEETEFVTKEVMEVSSEPLTKADIRSHEENGENEVLRQVIAVSPNSFSQAEPTLEILTEEARGHVGSEFLSEVAVKTESENLLHQNSIGETKAAIRSQEDYGETQVSRQVIAVSPNCFSQTEPTLEILTDEVRGLLGTEFLSEVAVESESENLLHLKSDEETKADIRSHEENGENEVLRQVIAVSPNSFSQAEPTLEILTEEARGHVGSEFLSEVAVKTESENLLHQNSIGETKAAIRSQEDYGETQVSRQVIAVSPNCFSQTEPTLEILIDEVRGLLGTEFLSEVAVESESENLLHLKSDEETKADIRSHEENGENEVLRQVIAVSPNSFSQAEPTLEILTEEARGHVGSEFLSEVAVKTESENLLHQNSIGETKAAIRSQEDYGETQVSRQVIAVSPNCFSQTEPTLEILTDEVRGLLGTEFLSEVAVESESENLLHLKSDEETKADIRSHEENGENEVLRQVIAVSPNSFSQDEPTLEILTEEAGGLEVQSEVAIETESENVLHQTSNRETKVGSRQVRAVADCLFAGNEGLSRINTEDIHGLSSSWQPMPEIKVRAPSEIRSEVIPAGMTIDTEKKFDERSNSCLSEDLKQSGTQSFLSIPNQKPNTELLNGAGRSEKYYSLSEIKDEENTDKWCLILSTLAAETFGDTNPIDELPPDDTGSQENQTPQTHAVSDDVLSKMDSSSTCNIWSRRGKAASVLQIRTNKSAGKQKQIGRQPKDKLHRKQALCDKSISLTVHHGAENLEPEIFTPDKENLTPSSHMLKRLQDIGDVKDNKSFSKLSGKSSSSLVHSSIAIVASEAFIEPEIFTPDKENLTPNSHMLKRLREFGDIKETKGSSSKATRKPFFDTHLEENVMAEQKPEDLHSMSSKLKVKHEPLAPKTKAERAPFQPLLEQSSPQSQSYTEASSITSARINISRGIRSPSILSDGKGKMKWTIVLDNSSLLDKESRKPLQLLQGLKGTHLVVPRIVLRELNEVKRSRSLLFRRRAEMASSALDWIEECQVNPKWWIQVQRPSEETKATAPTPPVTPQSNGSSAFPFSLHWNNYTPEIDSPTSEDQVLECALLYRNRNRDEKLVLLSNDVTLKIKAMAEGVICETAQEFYESLVNPFSERFMWTESTARGRTWSHLDDVVLRERYNNRACRRKSTYNGGGRGESGAAAKGLKLILLHNSHYGHTH